MKIDQETKEKDWFVKEPFLVSVGTKLTYTVKINLRDFLYVYEVLDEFMSNSTEDIRVEGSDGQIHERCSSPAFYLNFDKTSVITFELPSEFTVGKTVYEISTGKKLEVASEQSVNKSSEYIYCNIPGENGVYLIDKEELTFVKPAPKIQGITLDNIWFNEADEVEYFPTNPTPEQFEAMQEMVDLHAIEYQPNSQGGIKFDSKKARPTLLLKSMPHAVQEVIDVLELGARKYAPDNWKKVENERYHDAMLRHVLSYLGGEVNDPETSKHHLAHAVCNMLFLIQKEEESNALSEDIKRA